MPDQKLVKYAVTFELFIVTPEDDKPPTYEQVRGEVAVKLDAVFGESIIKNTNSRMQTVYLASVQGG